MSNTPYPLLVKPTQEAVWLIWKLDGFDHDQHVARKKNNMLSAGHPNWLFHHMDPCGDSEHVWLQCPSQFQEAKTGNASTEFLKASTNSLTDSFNQHERRRT